MKSEHTESKGRGGAFVRASTEVCGQINAPIEQVWSVFTNWSCLHEWMHAPPARRTIASSRLIDGQTEADLPRTRLVKFAAPDADQPAIHETLLHMDADAHTLYYSVSPIPAIGARNYLCYVTMDSVDGGTMMTLRARFDVTPPDLAQRAQEGIIAAHRDGMIAALDVYFSRRRSR